MLGRGKPFIDPSLMELHEDEQGGALAAAFCLKLVERKFRKKHVSPIKDSPEFDVLVARVAGPSFRRAEEQDPRELFDTAHALRDSRTVFAGSPLVESVYGDLFYRVLVAYGVAVDVMYQQRYGTTPMLDPMHTVEPPRLRLFLDATANRFADALLQKPLGTTAARDMRSALTAASDELFGCEPAIVTALQDQEPMTTRIYPAGWSLDYADVLDMTHDHELAEALSMPLPD